MPDDGTIVVQDPIGGPIGVALAEELGERAVLITQDNIAGNELARTGDLAPANNRLIQAGVVDREAVAAAGGPAGEVEVEDRFSGERRTIAVRGGRRLRVPAARRPDRRRRAAGR